MEHAHEEHGAEEVEHHLKYLGVVELVVSIATVYTVKIYEVAKELSGAWKPKVEGVEKKVKSLVEPLYKYVEGKPHALLLFFDEKVDAVMCGLKAHSPHAGAEKLKGALTGGVEWVKQVPDVLLDAALEVRKSGVAGTCRVYAGKWEPAAEEWARCAWRQFLRVPYSIEAVHVLAPPSLAAAHKLNSLLFALQKHQALPFITHIPALPVKHIETIIKREA